MMKNPLAVVSPLLRPGTAALRLFAGRRQWEMAGQCSAMSIFDHLSINGAFFVPKS
jgi:hypothetical protein